MILGQLIAVGAPYDKGVAIFYACLREKGDAPPEELPRGFHAIFVLYHALLVVRCVTGIRTASHPAGALRQSTLVPTLLQTSAVIRVPEIRADE